MDLTSGIALPTSNFPTQLDPSSPLLRFMAPPLGALPAPVNAPALIHNPFSLTGSASRQPGSTLAAPAIPPPAPPSAPGIGQVLANNSQLLAQSHDLITSNAQARQQAAEQRVAYLTHTGSGVDQIAHPLDANGNPTTQHPGFWRTLGSIGAHIGDDALTIAAPGVAALTPGTTLHHQMLLNQAEGQEGQAQNELQGQANLAQTGALTRHLNDESAGMEKPRPTYQPLSTDDGIFAFNPDNGTASAVTGPNGESLSKPEKTDPHYVTQDDGSIVAITTDKTGKPSAQVVYHGSPKQETQIVPLDIGGVEHSVIVDKRTGSQLQDLGPTGNRPPSVSVNTGTYSLAEMPDGNGGTKTVLLNSKTGQVADAPQGLAKPGTAAKNAAVLQPVQAALDYANDYLKNGVFTGSGDEALMEKYFELAKPSTGFRMTQPQIDMEMKGRSWMNSLEAHMRHATVGTWFSDDQRKQITNTMQDLYNSKVNAAQGNGNAPTQFSPQNSGQPRAGAAVTPPPANQPAGSIQVQIPGQSPGFIPRGALPQFRRDHPNAQVLQ